jgi:TrmH family RNA methyltransferase
MTLSKNDIARLRGLARQRRERHAAGRFVVEGEKLVREVLDSALTVHRVIVAEDDPPSLDAVVEVVPRHQLERVASTTSPQPVLAEVELPTPDWNDLATSAPVLVAVDLNDPGNVGTLARSAEAAGFAGLIVLGATADPWGPKTVRASAGALFRLPVVIESDAGRGLARLGELGFRRIGTRMDDATACDRADLSGPVALVLGSEAHGLGDAHAGAIDEWVSIPMAGHLESLNVAMSGAILTYEIGRQRRNPLDGRA